MAKLELYRKFTNYLAVFVLLSIAWIGYEVCHYLSLFSRYSTLQHIMLYLVATKMSCYGVCIFILWALWMFTYTFDLCLCLYWFCSFVLLWFLLPSYTSMLVTNIMSYGSMPGLFQVFGLYLPSLSWLWYASYGLLHATQQGMSHN